MNDFPVIVHLAMRTGLWDRWGKHCKSQQRNVRRGVISTLKVVFLDIECRILQWQPSEVCIDLQL